MKMFGNNLQTQLNRLGIKISANTKHELVNNNDLNLRIKALLTSIFPRHTKRFTNGFNFFVPMKLSECPFVMPEGANYDFYALGVIDNNTYICIDANDAQPEDPTVFLLDHYDPEQIPRQNGALSDFLTLLT